MPAIKPSKIEAELQKESFSRNATLSQLVTDWPRLQNIIYINNQPLSKLFEKAGLDVENLDPNDPNVLSKFKQILSPLLPCDVQPSSSLYNQLAGVLHQGGLPFRLETQTAKDLNENDRMLDNVKRGMSRRVDLVGNEDGFSVREVFIYNGNISQRDPDNPEFVQSEGHPMLSGRSEYMVYVNDTQIIPQLKSALLSTSEPELDSLLNGQGQKAEIAPSCRVQAASLEREKEDDSQYRSPGLA